MGRQKILCAGIKCDPCCGSKHSGDRQKSIKRALIEIVQKLLYGSLLIVKRGEFSILAT